MQYENSKVIWADKFRGFCGTSDEESAVPVLEYQRKGQEEKDYFIFTLAPRCIFTKKQANSACHKTIFFSARQLPFIEEEKEIDFVAMFVFFKNHPKPQWTHYATFMPSSELSHRKVVYGDSIACSQDGRLLAIGCPSLDDSDGWIEIHHVGESGGWASDRMLIVDRPVKPGAVLTIVRNTVYMDGKPVVGIVEEAL